MRLIALALAFFMTASLSGAVNADDAQRSPELKVLDRYLGEWETEATVKGTGDKSISHQSRKWSRQGKFVLSEELELATKKESHFLVTYDPKVKQYRSCFINEDVAVPLLGTWDEKSQTMHWKSADVPYQHDMVQHFTAKDRAEWTMTVTSPEGKIVLEISAKQTRRKP
jgi:hypothetical protein